MTMEGNDHAQWLRKQAKAFEKAALAEPEEKRRAAQAQMAARLRVSADALQMALQGIDPNAMGGSLGVAKRLGRGQRVTVRLLTGETLAGLMGSLGKYDFVLRDDGGRELVVAKHAVAYWIVEMVENGEAEPVAVG